MNNSELAREDFTYIFRAKIQSKISKMSNAFGWRKFKAEDFQINHFTIPIPKLPKSFRNYRLVHISDIHYGQWISYDRLLGAVGLINQLNPDLVAITGDFVSYLLDDTIEEMATILAELKAKDLTVAVLGNHDHWAGAERIRDILKKSKILDISNNLYIIRRADAKLIAAGVDSASVRKDRLDIVLQKIPPDGPAVLLAHEPDFAVKSEATKRFDLQLSGHSHGGQFIIPKLGTPIRGSHFRKYPIGRYKIGDMVQYTNRGLGTNSYWLRLNCAPEITVISLVEG